MDKKQFAEFCKGWKEKGALDFTSKSHYEELSPLVEAHAEVVEVQKDEFHELSGGQFYPRKETTDRIGMAAGIGFTGEPKTVQQPSGAWVASAYPKTLGPDGKMVTWAPASYEFNPKDRAEEAWLKDMIKNGTKEPSDAVKRLKILEMNKVALRRADTGSRVAAIISCIGMPTGFKNLFDKSERPDAVRYFLFSRIIANTKNEMVMARALDGMFGAAAMIAGPTPAAKQLDAPEEDEAPTMRDVSPATGFGASEPEPEPDPYDAYLQSFREIDLKYRKHLPPTELDNPVTSKPGRWDKILRNPKEFELQELSQVLTECKGYLKSKGIIGQTEELF